MATNKKIKLGVFLDDLEFILFSLKKNLLPIEIVYFVNKTSNVLSILPKDAKIAYYSFEKGYALQEGEDFLKAVVARSNFTKIAKEKKVSCFWLSLCQENVDFVSLWAHKNNFSLIGRPDLIKKLENKIFFDRFLAKHNIKKPNSQEIFYEQGKNIEFKHPFVLQDPVSSGGEGTFFIKNKNSLKQLNKSILRDKAKLLLRELVYGTPCGITLFIDKDRAITSSVRRQCFENADNLARRVFLGVQFLPYSHFNKKETEEINKTFFQISSIFRENKWFGLFNFDFIISKKGEIYLIECNPRISAASSLLFYYPELNNGFNIAEVFLESLFKEKVQKESFIFYGLGKNQFQGSIFYLDIEVSAGKSIKIKKVFKEGVYEQTDSNILFLSYNLNKISSPNKRFILKNEVCVGEVYKKAFTTSTILSNYPLFDSKGALSQAGEIIKKKFNYVD
ncbi:MAG: ATP-grasp domain-containing protein [Candidatus Gribaldobacteria bacterium]|nr:ATP-grasp domain-containing protein [Candidatus Gribaldobacteria bacterium]